MPAPQQNQYHSWIQAYDAVVKLGLASNFDEVISFPLNSQDASYTKATHSFAEITRKAMAELNNARLSNDEIRMIEGAVRAGNLSMADLDVVEKLKRVRAI